MCGCVCDIFSGRKKSGGINYRKRVSPGRMAELWLLVDEQTKKDQEIHLCQTLHSICLRDSDRITMDSYLSQLLSFPPQPLPVLPVSNADYDKQIKSFIQFLNQIPGSKLTSGVAGGSDLLDVINFFLISVCSILTNVMRPRRFWILQSILSHICIHC